jgi:drug/metabolite transporter (DMT)-like permease
LEEKLQGEKLWHEVAAVIWSVAIALCARGDLRLAKGLSDSTQAGGMDSAKSYRLGVLLVAASALFWSLAGIFPRIIQADTPTMLLWRGLFGCLLMFAYMVFEERYGIFKRLARMDRYSLLYAVIAAGAMQMFIASFRYTSVAHGAVIYAAVPFVAGGLGWLLLREMPSRTAIVSSLFALGGVGIMMGFGAGEGHISGDLLAFGATFAMALLMVLGRKYASIDLLAAACLSTVISALISFPFSGDIPSPRDMAWLAAFGMVNQAAGFICFAFGSRLLPPTETALIGALDAPLAPLWALLLFGIMPLPATLIGGGIVFLAVMAHFWLQTRRTDAAQIASLPT